MGITVTIVDHHPIKGRELKSENAPPGGLLTPTFIDRADVAGTVWKRIDPAGKRPDLVIGDTDPDGLSSLALYGLLFSPEARPRMISTRRILTPSWIGELELPENARILEFDRYMVYYTDYSPPGLFDAVTLLNPTHSGFPDKYCGANIVYDAVAPHLPEDAGETALTVAAVGIASDYGLGSPQGQEVLRAFAGKYRDCLPKLAALVDSGVRLTDQNVMAGTEMGALSNLFWAPLVFNGDDGSREAAELIADNPGFSARDLVSEESGNRAARYFQGYGRKLEGELRAEWASFGRKARFVQDPVNPDEEGIIFYVSESPYALLSSLVSTRASDMFPNHIVAWGSVREDGNLGYSLRRPADFRQRVDLGAIVSEMKLGGGGPVGAGCRGITDRDAFEAEFARRVYAAEGKG